MKTKSSLFLLVFSIALFLVSCEKEPGTKKGKVEFNSTIEDGLKSLKSTDSTIVISHAIIEIQNAAGEIILSNEEIALTKFGESYLSDPIDLTTGRYILTKFLLVNSENVVVYAAPLEGSEKAYLVNNPLPLEFVIDEDVVTKVSPEVIDAIGQTAASFGYATFSFNVVETFDFLIAVFVYNDSLENYELTDACLEVKTGADVLYLGNLQAITNQVSIKAGYDLYTISISKTGYSTKQVSCSVDSLKQFLINPLKMILTPSMNEDGLLAYWQFNGNGTDISGNNNTCTFYQTEFCADRFGIENNACYFKRAYGGYIQTPINDNALPYYTASGWYYWKGSNNSHAIGSFLATNEGWVWKILDNVIRYRQGTTLVISTINVVPNTWYYVAVTFDGSEATLYINGEKNISDTASISRGGNLVIGAIPKYMYYTNWDGMMDDIRIYNRALSAIEIKDEYQQSKSAY